MSDCVRRFLHSRLSHFHEVVEGGGEKLTRVHKDYITDPQLHISFSIQWNDAHVDVCRLPRLCRILSVFLVKELQHEMAIVRLQMVKQNRHEESPSDVIRHLR